MLMHQAIAAVGRFSPPLVWQPELKVVQHQGQRELRPAKPADQAVFDQWLPTTDVLAGGQGAIIGMIDERIRIHGLGVGLHRDGSALVEAHASTWAGTRRVREVLSAAMRLQPADIRVIPSTGFRATVTGGHRGKHEADAVYGTVGGFVQDERYLYAMSNNHVFARQNRGKEDDDLVGSNPPSVFGGLYDFVDLLEPPDRNVVDAAIGWINGDEPVALTYGVPSGSDDAELDMQVVKWGMRSGETIGTVTTLPLNTKVVYGIGKLDFQNSIGIRRDTGRFSLAGDSGSFVRDTETDAVVGLLFAKSGLTSLACPIEPALEELGVEISDAG